MQASASRYRIGAELGHGSYGTVYKARRDGVAQDLVVKAIGEFDCFVAAC